MQNYRHRQRPYATQNVSTFFNIRLSSNRLTKHWIPFPEKVVVVRKIKKYTTFIGRQVKLRLGEDLLGVQIYPCNRFPSLNNHYCVLHWMDGKRERVRDRQTDRHTDTPNRQTDRQTDTDREKDRQTETEKDRETQRQIDRQVDTHTHTHRKKLVSHI